MIALVVVVVFIFLMDYLSVWIVVTLPSASYWLGTPIGMLQTIIQAFVFTMALYSYYKAVTTPPGKIPDNWKPEGFTEEELEDAKVISTSKEKSRTRNSKWNAPRYCCRCERFKPPRAHHCSECNTCVPKMDHHCPWVNNCVGNNNHKLFFVFLFWGILGISYTMLVYAVKVILMFIALVNEEPVGITPIQGIIITVNVVILCPLILGMVSLFFWQQGLALQNTTTIEFHIRSYARKKAKRKGKRYMWPYDHGPTKNLVLFFGTKGSKWFCPVQPDNLTDGTYYPIAHVPEDDASDEEETYENPEEILDV